MRKFFALVFCLAWGLWFGGLIALFLAVTSLFATFASDHATAGAAAAGIFHRFERYQLILAAAGLASAFGWRACGGIGQRWKSALFWLLALATLAGASSTLLITPRIDALRQAGMTATPEFGKLHGESMVLYLGEAIALLAAGAALPRALRLDAPQPTPTT